MRDKIVAEAMTWLGTPYHHYAQAKGAGVDCAMFPLAVYQSVGVIPQEYKPRPYPHDWHMHRDDERYLNELSLYAVEVAGPVRGGMAVYKFGRTFSHGAICLGDGLIVHSYIGRGVVIDRMDDGDLHGRDVRFFDFAGDMT